MQRTKSAQLPSRSVLGIDAAWTARQPSGVALVVETLTGWQLRSLAPSYDPFLALAAGRDESAARPRGSLPVAQDLLDAAKAISGRDVDVVAVDMPLSRDPIVGRREADNAVSREYGGRKCGAHSPSGERPGKLSDDLRVDFEAAGVLLRTAVFKGRGLIEVYPHPALVELANAEVRLPYKASKVNSYWKLATPGDRRAMLFDQWRAITVLLDGEIGGVTSALPEIGPGASGVAVKAYEDMLDAVICTWVGVMALAGKAEPFGDEQAAIWVPKLSPQRSLRTMNITPATG